MTRNIIALSGLVLLVAGCHTGHRGISRTELASSPELGNISEYFKYDGTKQVVERVGPYVIWEQPEGSRKTLNTLVLASGSPGYGTSDFDPRLCRQHVTPDGKRAWLEKDGKIVASFDLEAGVANLSPVGHPSWATTQPTGP